MYANDIFQQELYTSWFKQILHYLCHHTLSIVKINIFLWYCSSFQSHSNLTRVTMTHHKLFSLFHLFIFVENINKLNKSNNLSCFATIHYIYIYIFSLLTYIIEREKYNNCENLFVYIYIYIIGEMTLLYSVNKITEVKAQSSKSFNCK